MKKKIIFLISFFIINVQAQEGLEISIFTEQVYKRYYFIARLEKTMEFFLLLKEDNYPWINEECIKKLYIYKHLFSHEIITKTIEELLSLKTIKPLFDIWFDFRSYKYLNNEHFLQEFTKLILLFSEKILLYTIDHQEKFFANSGKIQVMLENGLRVPDAERLDYIDQIIDFLQKIILKNNMLSFMKSLMVRCSTLKKNYTQAVSQRLYYLNRLEKPISLILEFYKNPIVCFESLRICHFIFDNKVTFIHERINFCINAMEETCSLQPLDELWHEFKHYKYLDDDLFVKELTKVIFIIEKNIIAHSILSKPIERYSFDYLLALYEKIDTLPLEEILNAIDTLSHELPLISQKYELETNISWKEWFHKYWWAPPLILGTFSLKFLLTIKNIKIIINLLKPSNKEDALENSTLENSENVSTNHSSELST